MSESDLKAVLVIGGTLLPVAGVAFTLILGWILPGWWRWAVLFGGPAVTWAICWAIAEPVMRDGNMLAAILYILLYLFVIVYYPVLCIVAATVWWRRGMKDERP